MRILNLRLKNLNSLVGEWSIDFTHPDYEINGIFAIIGPTGAGKSTLLDAICLALYGKTPRLDKISKSSNEVMARQTGECFAEVTFETARGKYRCFWAQQRSHKKVDGDLQNAKREIVDATTDTILESQLNKVDAKIEEITGMDFQRFTRSMLLAQGSFDVFLKASPSERAPVLEQITGTEIYSKISIGVFERAKVEAKTLEGLQDSLTAIHLLSEEDQKNYLNEHNEKFKSIIHLAKKLQILNENKAWRCEFDRIDHDLKDSETNWNVYIAKEKAAQIDLTKLEQALKALNFEGDFRDLCGLKKLQKDDLESHSTTIIEQQALDKALFEKSKEHENSQKKYEELLIVQKQELDIIKQVREIDKDEFRGRKKLDELSTSLAEEEKSHAVQKKFLEKHQEKEKKLKVNLKTIQKYLEGCAGDETLVEKFSSIEINLDRFKKTKKIIEAKQTKYKTSLEQLSDAKKQINGHQKSYEEAKTNSESAKSLLKKISADFDKISEGKNFLQWGEEQKERILQEKLFEELITVLETVQNSEDTQKLTLGSIKVFETELKVCQKSEGANLQKKQQLDHKIDELLRQQILQERIQSLEEDRTQLSDNIPCPLCGSLEHPFAHENIPDLSNIDKQLCESRLESKKLERTIKGLSKKVTESEIEIKNSTKSLQKEIKSLSEFREKSKRLFEQLGFNKKKCLKLSEAIIQHKDKHKELKEFEKKYSAYLKKVNDREIAQKAFDKEVKKYSKFSLQLDELTTAKNKYERDTIYLRQEQEQLKIEYNELENFILESIRLYGIFTLKNVDLDIIKEDLFQRSNQWKEQINAKKQLEDDAQKVLLQITIEKGHTEQKESNLKTLLNEIKQCAKYVEELFGKRQHLFGTKDPDKEERVLQKRIEKADLDLAALKEAYNKMLHNQETLKSKIIHLNETILVRSQTLQKDEKKFNDKIYEGGFSDLDAYSKAPLSQEDRERLTGLKDLLEKNKSEILAEKKTAEKRFAELNQAPKTGETLLALMEQIKEVTSLHDSEKERDLKIKIILDENEKKKERAKAIQAKITLQAKETNIWKGLSILIGAADGKKFRDIAQKMTLEMMIAHANRQLIKMSDRYLLRQSKISPLELDVVDNYQAGEERSVKNLSGGEGFIVSLSLALGLSQMSSSKVRVDSLFLDEGFGSLDERALEVALDTLSELHQEGKVIGLISHVTVLKERISTQIKVQPVSGGRSRIQGPGCCEIKK